MTVIGPNGTQVLHTDFTNHGGDPVTAADPASGSDAGDVVRLHFRWVDKRVSKSRPESGMARHFSELKRADGVALLSIYEIILIRRRQPG